jgi:hypothetical protein
MLPLEGNADLSARWFYMTANDLALTNWSSTKKHNF